MMPKQKNKTSKRCVRKVENILIHIANLKCSVDVDSEVYSKEDKKNLKDIVDKMSKNIWIDRTYVLFRGNRWKDAFIKEEGWKELVGILNRTDFGKRVTKEENDNLMSSMLAIAITYLYDVVGKYGFEADSISIDFKDGCKFYAEYMEDRRKEWIF